jgi:ligand-binding sensor domain-containing protein
MIKSRVCLTKSLLLFFSLLSVSLQSQVSSFKKFGLEKTAFPSRIECIDQAQSGELYIGTLAGLVIYDGYRFEQLFERDGLAENAISAISIQADNVWIGHWAGSITVINSRNRETRTIDISDELSYNSIEFIEPISDTSAYVVSKDGRILLYTPQGLEQILVSENYQSENIRSLQSDTNGYFVITDYGVYKTSNNLKSIKWKTIYKSEEVITASTYLQSGEWIIGTKKGALFFDFKTGASSVIDMMGASSTVVSIVQDVEEFIWIATEDEGIIRLHAITGRSERITKSNGLSYNQVQAMFHDREGQIWIATAAGLDQYLGNAFVLFDQKVGLPDNIVWDFVQDGNGFMVASPSGLHVLEFSKEDNKYTIVREIDLLGEEPRNIISRQIGNLIYVITQGNNLWVGSWNGSFQQVDDVSGEALCLEEVNGEIWVGTNKGIVLLNNNKAVEQYSVEIGLGGTRVNGIYYSKVKNETWITVLGGSCALYREGRFKLFGADEGMTSNVIQDVSFDSDGNPWFATYDEGVFYYKDGLFQNISTKVSLSSNTTFAIVIDKDDVVWIGHNWGLDMYRIRYEDMRSFNSSNGFMGVEVNPGSLSLDKQNNLWMGTLMGIQKFTASNLRVYLTEPLTRIVRAKLGDYEISDGNSYRLGFGESNFKVQYSGISLVNPEENSFQYRLIGVHDQWRTRNEVSPIEYGALPPGEFTFEVKTCMEKGNCSPSPATITFKILPPFYRAWWFYTLLFVLVVLGIYLMDRFRVLSLVDQKNALSEKLLVSEQGLIELSNELDTLKERSIVNSKMMLDMIDQGGLISSTMIPERLKIEDVSSDQIIELAIGEYRISGLLDVGVSGEIAIFLVESIKAEFYKRMLDVDPITMDTVNSIFNDAASFVTSKLEKHKGYNWVLLIESGSEVKLNCYNNTCYQLVEGQVVEYHGSKGLKKGAFFEVNREGYLLFTSDGFVDQLSADGSHSFGQRKLISALANYSKMKQEDILMNLKTDINNWRGSMDLTDDITIITYKL